jgi:hypothetical protein
MTSIFDTPILEAFFVGEDERLAPVVEAAVDGKQTLGELTKADLIRLKSIFENVDEHAENSDRRLAALRRLISK